MQKVSKSFFAKVNLHEWLKYEQNKKVKSLKQIFPLTKILNLIWTFFLKKIKPIFKNTPFLTFKFILCKFTQIVPHFGNLSLSFIQIYNIFCFPIPMWLIYRELTQQNSLSGNLADSLTITYSFSPGFKLTFKVIVVILLSGSNKWNKLNLSLGKL